jgi:hypothetical protein
LIGIIDWRLAEPYPRTTVQIIEMIGIVRQVQTSPTPTRFSSDPVPAGSRVATTSPQPVAPNTAAAPHDPRGEIGHALGRGNSGSRSAHIGGHL